MEASELAVGPPRRRQRVLSRLERGEFELNIRREQLEEVTREFRHTANRLSMALIVDASVVALSVVMGVRDGGQIRQ